MCLRVSQTHVNAYICACVLFSTLAYIDVCAYDISCFFKKATPAFFADVAKSIYVREMRRFDAPLFPTIAS